MKTPFPALFSFFQSLENAPEIFPIIGNFFQRFSNHWKLKNRTRSKEPIVLKHFISYCFAFGAVFSLLSSAHAAETSFEQDVQALTRTPHRLAGSAEYAQAAEYVQQRMEQIGLDDVFVQEFPLAQTQVDRCEAITATGRVIPLQPARPNGIIPSTTPPAGIRGELVYAGAGTADDFERADPKDRIVVMDYNCGDQFLQAFRLGAKAIIFVRNDPTQAGNFHYVNANANLQRFFYEGPLSDLPIGESITLYSDVNWTRHVGRNVIGFLKGSDPVFNLKKDEVIILAARLDTFGEIPRVTPGARGAANCAGLLKLAEELKTNRPKRDTVFLFLDAEARLHTGAAAFYGALEQDDPAMDVTKRLSYIDEEQEFLHNMQQVIDSDTVFEQQTSSYGRDLARRLRSQAADDAYRLRAQLMDARELLNKLQKQKNPPADTAELSVLGERIIQLEADKNQWNELRRGLGKSDVSEALQPLFRRVLAAVKADTEIRQDELKEQRSMLETSQRISNLLQDKWITLHASLQLGDTTDRWGLLIGGDSSIHSRQDKPGLYSKVQQCFLTAWRELDAAGSPPNHFALASVNETITHTRLLWAAPMLIHSGEIAGRFGIYNVVLGTIQERLPREGTPDDTMDQLNLPLIEQDIHEISLMLSKGPAAVANQENLSLRRSIRTDKQFITSYFDNGRPQGSLCMGRQRGSSMPNMPVQGAAVQLATEQQWNRCFWPYNKAYGYDTFYVVLTDQNGAYSCGPLPEGENSTFGFSAAFNAHGQPVMASDNASANNALTRLNMFNCASGFFMLPPGLWQARAKIMNARANASISDATYEKAYTETTDGVVLFFCEDKLPGIKAFALKSIAELVYSPDASVKAKDEKYGTGIPLNTEWSTLLTANQSAWDLWQLNESRLNIMRKRDIMNSSLEELHGRIRDTLDESKSNPSPTQREAIQAASFLASTPVYAMVRTSMDDLVTAVLILLALCVPFAFALERLLIGASMIYKQVMWFAIFFIITFLILYVSHPAFAIAQTPIIIFLGFTVVVLSVLVIFIIMQKFEVELKQLQGMTATVHASDISRFNTIMAAMSMGISTMRRRPLRTALTAVTIILLTFTILCFASFDTQKGIISLFTAPSPPYTGVLMRNATYGSYNPDFLDIVEGRWGQSATVCPRYWVCREFKQDPNFVVSHDDGSNPVTLRGILGLSPRELARRQDLRTLLHLKNTDDFEQQVYITDAVAELLKVKPGDPVIIRGLHLTVGPLLDAAALSVARDMDGSSILPVDFLAMKSAQADVKQSNSSATDEQDKWSSLPVDSIVIMSAANAKLAYAKCHAIPIYTEDTHQAEVIAEETARMLDKTPILATRKNGVYRHILGTTVAASGVSDLLFRCCWADSSSLAQCSARSLTAKRKFSPSVRLVWHRRMWPACSLPRHWSILSSAGSEAISLRRGP